MVGGARGRRRSWLVWRGWLARRSWLPRRTWLLRRSWRRLAPPRSLAAVVALAAVLVTGTLTAGAAATRTATGPALTTADHPATDPSGCIGYIGDAHLSTSPQSAGDIKVGGGIAGCRSQVSFVYLTVVLYKTGDGTSHLVARTNCSSTQPRVECSWSFNATPNDTYPPPVPAGHYFFNQNSHFPCQYRKGITTTFFGDLTQPTYVIYQGNSYWAPANTYSIGTFVQHNCWTPTDR
jgi:hypothetical protein